MFAISFLNVVLAISPLFYYGFGNPSPRNVYHDDWMINERNDRRSNVGYHDQDGWVIIGPKDGRRNGDSYTDRRDNNHQPDRRNEDIRYDWQRRGNYNDRTSSNYNEWKYDIYGNNYNDLGRSQNSNNWNAYPPYLQATGSTPIQNDWRYYNGTVDDEVQPKGDKRANIQVNPYILGQGWWYKANSDARWDNETGDLWKDPRGPEANVVTKATTTTLSSNVTANITAESS